ncbi:MAG: hypothetical protein NHF95_00515, partial [Candidatus Shikimatogenerans sp. JK-2022]|nr:hypothetical protein [Candidatus Shikimatogenerans bostrichidophilus]
IKNYSDPRLCTIKSFKKRGYKPKYLINFIKQIGYTKRINNISIKLLENNIKKKIIKKTIKLLVIFKPIKIIILNYPNKLVTWIYIKNNKINNLIIPFTKKIYIEKNDINIEQKNFFRLNYYNYVRLKYYFIIKLKKIINNNIYCKIYNNNKYKKNKIKSTIQWISNQYYNYIYLLLYDYIYYKNNKLFYKKIIKKKVYIDISIKKIKKKKIYQFHRIGLFYYYKKNIFKKIILFKQKLNI